MIDNTKFMNKFRVRTGPMASTDRMGMQGAFMIPCGRETLGVVSSDGSDWEAERLPLPAWEHVYVSLPSRTPTWGEMCYIKSLFFHPDDCVVEFHPPREQYVNCHCFCLHMWKPIGIEMPMPPSICVGPKEKSGK